MYNAHYLKEVKLSKEKQNECIKNGNVYWRNKKIYCLTLVDDTFAFGYDIKREKADYVYIENYTGNNKSLDIPCLNVKNIAKTTTSNTVIYNIKHIKILANIEHWLH